jgi:hypothetical protein
MMIRLKPFRFKLRKEKPAKLNPKLETELKTIVGSSSFAELIGHEILYQLSEAEEPKYIYWAKIIELSPNNKFVKLVDCEEYQTPPYFRDVSTIELVDLLD